MTGIGIGGEYAAINSAIDELIPARLRRGWTDLAINGSWWVGRIAGRRRRSCLSSSVYPSTGWRICFWLLGAARPRLLFIRRNLPESPRYLMTHGRLEEAEEVVKDIEQTVERRRTGQELPPPSGNTIEIGSNSGVGSASSGS